MRATYLIVVLLAVSAVQANKNWHKHETRDIDETIKELMDDLYEVAGLIYLDSRGADSSIRTIITRVIYDNVYDNNARLGLISSELEGIRNYTLTTIDQLNQAAVQNGVDIAQCTGNFKDKYESIEKFTHIIIDNCMRETRVPDFDYNFPLDVMNKYHEQVVNCGTNTECLTSLLPNITSAILREPLIRHQLAMYKQDVAISTQSGMILCAEYGIQYYHLDLSMLMQNVNQCVATIMQSNAFAVDLHNTRDINEDVENGLKQLSNVVQQSINEGVVGFNTSVSMVHFMGELIYTHVTTYVDNIYLHYGVRNLESLSNNAEKLGITVSNCLQDASNQLPTVAADIISDTHEGIDSLFSLVSNAGNNIWHHLKVVEEYKLQAQNCGTNTECLTAVSAKITNAIVLEPLNVYQTAMNISDLIYTKLSSISMCSTFAVSTLAKEHTLIFKNVDACIADIF